MAGTVTLRGRCQAVGSQRHAADWCLSSEADSHQTKAPIERGIAKPVFRRQREPGGSFRRPEKDGLASGGRWKGCYGGSPLEWVAPHEVGARESLVPRRFHIRSIVDPVLGNLDGEEERGYFQRCLVFSVTDLRIFQSSTPRASAMRRKTSRVGFRRSRSKREIMLT